MPSRHEIKEDVPGGIYHAYNRGVERRRIFLDGRDYQRYLRQLRQSLDREPAIELLAFCLMPNHIHLLLRQAESVAMASFMNRLTIAYVMYFNKKYKRVGALFQGKYKAVRIVGPQHLMDASRYIHRNPERAGMDWRQHTYSSRLYYLDPASSPTPGLVNTEYVMSCFDYPKQYLEFLKLRA